MKVSHVCNEVLQDVLTCNVEHSGDFSCVDVLFFLDHVTFINCPT